MLVYLPILLALLAQNSNTYLGPNKKVSKDYVQVQVSVNDERDPGGVKIISASFDGKNIPLKPRDVDGFRGQAGFQVKPGKYRVKWEVNRDKTAWPRTASHEETVNITNRDIWYDITIVGESLQ